MRSVYVASTEGFSSKSTVARGLLEQLSRRVERVGVFRPVVRLGVVNTVAITAIQAQEPALAEGTT